MDTYIIKRDGSKEMELVQKIIESIRKECASYDWTETPNAFKCSHHILDGAKSKKDRFGGTVLFKNGAVIDTHTGNTSVIDFYCQYKGRPIPRKGDGEFVKLCKDMGIEMGNTEDYAKLQQRCEQAERINKQKQALQQALVANMKAQTTATAKTAHELMLARGWTDEMMATVEIGCLDTPEQRQKLNEISNGLQILDDKETSNNAPAIGKSNVVAIPFYCLGQLIGWNFRTIGEGGAKYIQTAGVSRGKYLQGLVWCREANTDKVLILVEGDLDCLHARALGVESVAGIGSNTLTRDQAKLALGAGYRTVLLLLDNDKAGIEGTAKSVQVLYEVAEEMGIEKYGQNRLWVGVSSLTNTIDTDHSAKMDTDAYLKDHTIAEWSDLVLKSAKRPFGLEVQYATTDENTGAPIDLSLDRNRAVLVGKLRSIIAHTPDEDQQPLHDALLEQAETLRVARPDMEAIYQNTRDTANSKARKEIMDKALAKIDKLRQQGNNEEACKEMAKAVEKLNKKRDLTDSENLHKKQKDPYEVLRRMGKFEVGIPTGFAFYGSKDKKTQWTIKEGISLLTGSTGHRKTTMLLNVALNEAERQHKLRDAGKPFKKVIYYTYEQSEEDVLRTALTIWLDCADVDLEAVKAFLAEKDGKAGIDRENNGIIKIKTKDRYGIIDIQEINLKERSVEFANHFIIDDVLEIVYCDFPVGKLCGDLEFVKLRNDISFIAVDYVQLIAPDEKGRQRTEELATIVRTIKDTAVKNHLHILMGAQFNRTVTTPLDVVASNIGESVALEQIATDVVGVYNLYNLPIAQLIRTEQSNQQNNFTLRTLYALNVKATKNDPRIADNVKEKQKELDFLLSQTNDPTGEKEIETSIENALYLRHIKGRGQFAGLDALVLIHSSTGRVEMNDPEQYNENE